MLFLQDTKNYIYNTTFEIQTQFQSSVKTFKKKIEGYERPLMVVAASAITLIAAKVLLDAFTPAEQTKTTNSTTDLIKISSQTPSLPFSNSTANLDKCFEPICIADYNSKTLIPTRLLRCDLDLTRKSYTKPTSSLPIQSLNATRLAVILEPLSNPVVQNQTMPLNSSFIQVCNQAETIAKVFPSAVENLSQKLKFMQNSPLVNNITGTLHQLVHWKILTWEWEVDRFNHILESGVDRNLWLFLSNPKNGNPSCVLNLTQMQQAKMAANAQKIGELYLAEQQKRGQVAREVENIPSQKMTNLNQVQQQFYDLLNAIWTSNIDRVKALSNTSNWPIIVNQEDQEGYTPLATAVLTKNYEMIRFLLKREAIAYKIPGQNGNYPPLTIAVKNKDMFTAMLLMDAGAIPKEKDKHGLNAFAYANMDDLDMYCLLVGYPSYYLQGSLGDQITYSINQPLVIAKTIADYWAKIVEYLYS